MLVLSTSLFNKPPFQNLIANGTATAADGRLVLAADGRKMSKRLQNYPPLSEVLQQGRKMSKRLQNYPPLSEVLQQLGADGLRLYLLNSPFFIQEVTRYEASTGKKFSAAEEKNEKDKKNCMDRWILSETQRVIQFVKEEIESYRLYTLVPQLLSFLESLTNWYLRLNRDRMRGACGPEEALEGLQTLYSVLLTTIVYMAPLTPFMSEYLYGALKKGLPSNHFLFSDSVHFLLLPSPREELRNENEEKKIKRMQNVIIMGRNLREKRKISLKTPVAQLRCLVSSQQHAADLLETESYIKEELNACELVVSVDKSEAPLSLSLNFKLLGPRVGRQLQQLQAAASSCSQQQLLQFEKEGEIELAGIKLTKEDATILRQTPKLDNPNLAVTCDRSVVVIMDFTADPSLQRKAVAREVANRVQKLRKQLQLQQHDEVPMFASSSDPSLFSILQEEEKHLKAEKKIHLHAAAAAAAAAADAAAAAAAVAAAAAAAVAAAAAGAAAATTTPAAGAAAEATTTAAAAAATAAAAAATAAACS
ncbi:isoleucine-tRNA synthetase, putative [Eimeria brunetti]|uniref:Isoleucine-tRNA synthetase, putative n=1 Tax=Eimeria brunetti TaxID=51314 RepID=U6LEI9_9EIME|nr:isoleucine-tRNA synthetase, putative [Eimeria brunetti]